VLCAELRVVVLRWAELVVDWASELMDSSGEGGLRRRGLPSRLWVLGGLGPLKVS
jgi:hypothetical protein